MQTKSIQNDTRDLRTHSIIGAAMDVHSRLGSGFLEQVYQDALELEFRWRNIPHQREAPIDIKYRGELLPSRYQADFLCFGQVIVELKCLSNINPIAVAQVINYLKATGLQTALLFNFKTPSLQFQRVALTH